MPRNQVVVDPSNHLVVEVQSPGPQGPPGTGGGGGVAEPALELDYAGPRYHYLGYASRIVRLDYASAPAVVGEVATADLDTDWPNRASLTYI